MKRYLIIIVFLSLLVGCATSNQVSTTGFDDPQAPVVVRGPSPDQPQTLNAAAKASPGTGQAVKSKQKNVQPSRKKTVNASVRHKEQPYSLEMRVDDDDNISSLLRHNYNQNFDIPIVFNDAVKYYVKWFSEDKKDVFARWLKRSRLYVPIITEILRDQNMPEDLVYLAMIESGFNPKAYSRAKASGPWQFIYSTGDRYGLDVNYWVDERRDPEKSTVAAAKYLKDLFNQFGCWYLAAASYNAGEGRIGRAIEKHNTNDFWELYKYDRIPKETREYIPQLIAAAIIAKDPVKFGFGSIVYDAPVRFKELNVPAATPVEAIAKASSLDIDTVRSCNPEILRGITPPGAGSYVIKLPADVNKEAFYDKLEAELDGAPKIKSITTYKVKKKDTLNRIVKKYNVKAEDVLLVNSANNDLRIKPGMVIAIPKYFGDSTSHTVLASSVAQDPASVKKQKTVRKSDEEKPARADAAKRTARQENTVKKDEKEENVRPVKTFHIVKKGETLSDISERYGIDKSTLSYANKLKGGRVYPNMKLRLVSHVDQKKTKNVTVASHADKKNTKTAKAKNIKYHTVRKGETLSSISEKYGIDVDDLKAANKIKGNKIHAKMKLKIVRQEG